MNLNEYMKEDLGKIVEKVKQTESLTKEDFANKQDSNETSNVDTTENTTTSSREKVKIQLVDFGKWFVKQHFDNVHKVELKVKGIDPDQYTLLSYKSDTKAPPERFLYCYDNYMVPDVSPGTKIRIFKNSSMFIIAKLEDGYSLVTLANGRGKKSVAFVCWEVNNNLLAYQRVDVKGDFEVELVEKMDFNQTIPNDKRENLELSYPLASKLRDKKTYYEISSALTSKFLNVFELNHLKNILNAEVKMFA